MNVDVLQSFEQLNFWSDLFLNMSFQLKEKDM